MEQWQIDKKEELLKEYLKVKHKLIDIGAMVTMRGLPSIEEMKGYNHKRVPDFIQEFVEWVENVNIFYREVYGFKKREKKDR